MRRSAARVALCVALSLLLHGVLAWGVLALAKRWGQPGVGTAQVAQAERKPKERALQIITSPPEPEETPPFAKTSPDRPEETPQQVDFIGKRDAVASGAEDAPRRSGEEPVPTQNGVEREGEVVTFDQKAQEGDMAYDGRADAASAPPLPPLPQGPPQPALPPTPPATPTPPMEGVAQAEPTDAPAEVQEPPAPAAAGMKAVEPPPPGEEGDVRVAEQDSEQEVVEATAPPAVSPVPIQMAVSPPSSFPALPRQPIYDPALADHMQQRPGFRTLERRTRSTGQFVIGKHPSLNVAATPQGRYEEEIYRRIAHSWYIACDEHRGDIIPGSVVVSLRIDRRGLLQNMDLVSRRGASVIQQSFTFGAIRRSTLPPMPPEVQREIVGDLLELIFRFHFD